jgi:hypothetical protein
VTLTASLGSGLSTSAQIESVTGEVLYFIDVNPSNHKQPTWLSFDLLLFKSLKISPILEISCL